jgi:hypothetical protein
VIACPPAASVPAADEPEPTASDDDGLVLVDRAVQSGRWRAEDVEELRRLMPAMSADGRRKSVAALMLAINQQRLAVEALPPL